MKTSNPEQELMERLWSPDLKHDPEAFVMFVYPWGEPGTPLEKFSGPREWQRKALRALRDHIREMMLGEVTGAPLRLFKQAVVSGRGIGKSALVSWITHWFRSCWLGSSCIVSANNETQLKSITWAEMGKWLAMAINSHWFDKGALTITPAKWFRTAVEKQLRVDGTYWYTQARLWDDENPDGFAGAHNMQGMMVIFDEASGIPESIFRVTEGFFTEPILPRFWLMFSNGRRNTGAFFDAFHAPGSDWKTESIDSRTVEGVDLDWCNSVIDRYGEDSDTAAIEVKGRFPKTGLKQLISRYRVLEAMARKPFADPGAGLVMGVDVARYGDDRTVFAFRAGRDAASIPWQDFKGLSITDIVRRAAAAADTYRPDLICVDGNGVGAGVVDGLKELRYPVADVQLGSRASEPARFANLRTDLWNQMADWMSIGSIPVDEELTADLTGPEYDINRSGAMLLEPKEQMKKRGLVSPDKADALALTFARRVSRRDGHRIGSRNRVARDVDYDVLG